MSAFEKFQRFLVIILIALGFFYGGYYFGKKGYLIELKKNPPEIKITNRYPQNSEVDFALFWKVWDLVSKEYLMRPVDTNKMMYGAVTGMVEALGDPYTSYLPPTLNETVNNSLNGKYQGIGAELDIRENQLMIVSPLDGSPAQKVGLRPGDKILEIDGQSTIGVTVAEAVSKIRGEAGTIVKLKIQTANDEPRDVEITRDTITIESVRWEDKGDGTAYIRISRFGGETNAEWSKKVSEVNSKMQELDALIIDVRGNPGGYLQSAIFISEEFYRDKPIVWQEDALGKQESFVGKRVGAFADIPAIYVLIDEGSASASEILAASLKENMGATLIGKKSFGKGTIQEAVNFEEDGSGVHITVAKWLTPNKTWVHQKGIDPDVVVEITNEDLKNSKDTQLEKAVELAKQI